MTTRATDVLSASHILQLKVDTIYTIDKTDSWHIISYEYVQYSAVPYLTVPYSTVPVQYSTVQYSTVVVPL